MVFIGLSIALVTAILILLPLLKSILPHRGVDLYHQNASYEPYIVLEFDDEYLETYTKAYLIL